MFFNFFKKKINYQTGILPDLRSDEEKALDYTLTEFVTAPAPVDWNTTPPIIDTPIRKQNGSGSCVAQALERERGIMARQKYGEFVQTSASFTYQKRANPNVSGSTAMDRINYANMGSVKNTDCPDQSMTDVQMLVQTCPAYITDTAKILGCKSVTVPIDIDTIASTIETTGKGVGVWFRFGPGEWFNRKEVGMVSGSTMPWGHAVVAVGRCKASNGEKALIVPDSACEDGFPYRIVPESFLKARCFYAAYLMNFKTYDELPEKPHFDGSVVSAQDCLKYERLFPSNVTSTGTIGPVTTKALKMFQIKYDIAPATGNFGPLTKAKLLEIYP